jgi:predicted DNA-binding protein YlxM (UPF0122 family)
MKPLKKKYTNIPVLLKKLLTKEQRDILQLYLASYHINDIMELLKIKRSEIPLNFIYIGKKMALYEMLECKIYPNLKMLRGSYLEGFNDCKKILKKEICNQTHLRYKNEKR